MTRRYPFAPLAAAMRLSENQAAIALGMSGSTRRRVAAEGLSELQADRFAGKARFLPYEIWPDWGAEAVEGLTRVCCGEDCDETFLINPGRGGGNRRWCSEPCRARHSMRAFRATERGREANRRNSRAYKAYLAARRAA